MLLCISGYLRYHYGVWIPSRNLYFAFPRELDFLGLIIAGAALSYIFHSSVQKQSSRYWDWIPDWIGTQSFTMTALALLFLTGILKSATFVIISGLANFMVNQYHGHR